VVVATANDVSHVPIEQQRRIKRYAKQLSGIAERNSGSTNISAVRQFYSTEMLYSTEHDRFSLAWVQ